MSNDREFMVTEVSMASEESSDEKLTLRAIGQWSRYITVLAPLGSYRCGDIIVMTLYLVDSSDDRRA